MILFYFFQDFSIFVNCVKKDNFPNKKIGREKKKMLTYLDHDERIDDNRRFG